MSEIMTPASPRWEEFIERLESPEGCNLERISGKTTWTCAGGNNKDKARRILKSMGGVDIESTLQYFDEHGGHCDCEILLNVDR